MPANREKGGVQKKKRMPKRLHRNPTTTAGGLTKGRKKEPGEEREAKAKREGGGEN